MFFSLWYQCVLKFCIINDIQKLSMCIQLSLNCSFIGEFFVEGVLEPFTTWSNVTGYHMSWRSIHMETLSSLLAFCEGNSQVTGGFPSQRVSKMDIDVVFDISLNKSLNKQWSCQWFGTPWHLCDVTAMIARTSGEQRAAHLELARYASSLALTTPWDVFCKYLWKHWVHCDKT